MRQIGDIVRWNSKYGEETGVVENAIRFVKYIIRVDRSGGHIVLTDDRLDQEPAGDPNAEFVQLIAEMRAAQREYFSTRSAVALSESQRLEKKVDQVIRIFKGKQ